MSFAKSALVATLAAAVALGSSMSAANAGSKKAGYFIAGAVATALVVAAVKDDCKKYKRAYDRTGNPKYLDRYYACM
jgi:hypothetical protein